MTAMGETLCAACDLHHDCFRDSHLLSIDTTRVTPKGPGEAYAPRRYVCGACGDTIQVPACAKCGAPIKPASDAQLSLGRQPYQPILPTRQQGSVQSFGLMARTPEEA